MGIEIDPNFSASIIEEYPSVQFCAKPGYVAMILSNKDESHEIKLSPSYAEALGGHIFNLAMDSRLRGAYLEYAMRSTSQEKIAKEMPTQHSRPLQLLQTLVKKIRQWTAGDGR